MKGNLLINKNDILIIGVPFDSNSSLTYGCSLAPDAIRTFIKSGSSNWSTESGIDISKTERVKDLGNLKITSYLSIEDEFVKLLKRDVKIVTIGGDHSITFPILKAFSKYYKDIEILHIDAHPDLYEKFQDNPYSHACPFLRIAEEKLAKKIFSMGIRASTPEQKAQAEKFGIEIIEVENLEKLKRVKFSSPLYISIDLDSLDPAFAPGVSHPEPGGISTRELISIIKGIGAELIGADIVEFNPLKDINSITASVAFKILKELIGNLLSHIYIT